MSIASIVTVFASFLVFSSGLLRSNIFYRHSNLRYQRASVRRILLKKDLHATASSSARFFQESWGLKHVAERIGKRIDESVAGIGSAVQSQNVFVAGQQLKIGSSITIDKARQIRAEVAAAGVAPNGIWSKRVWTIRRSVRIYVFLLRSLIKAILLNWREKKLSLEAASKARREFARYLCRGCLRLGPTFIKVGQLMSTRIDLLSKEYIEELRRLQDDVPGFGKTAAVAIIESELGAPISELFDSFNDEHFAAASLGQVHEAWVNNKKYAVKIQRPGVQDMFAVDLGCLQTLAYLLDRFDPKMDGTSKDWGAIFGENSRVLYEEIDYIREGRNANRFAENFKNTPWLKTPGILWELSTSKVLTMEYVEGIKISDVDKIDAAGLDRSLLARRIAQCYLAQLIRHGLFHADPHSGNLAVDGKNGGTIIFYDYGMMDEVPLKTKRGFVDLVFGIYENDVQVVCNALEEMDIIRRGADRMTLERVARFYLNEFKTTMEKGGAWINQLDKQGEEELRRRERAKIGQELFSVKSDIPLQFPAAFTFVFRAFTTLDGIGKTLDPNYDLTRIAQPYLKELVDLRDGNAYVSILNSWAKRVGWRKQDIAALVTSPRRVAHIDEVARKLEEGDLKLQVRVMESEASFRRLETQQGSLSAALLATLSLNAGMALMGTNAKILTLMSRFLFVVSAYCCAQVPVGYIKLWQLRQRSNSQGYR